MEFRAEVELGGKTATGICVPDELVDALGGGRRPAVRVSLGSHTYRTTVARMGGRYLVPLSAQNRAAAGVAAGDQVGVRIELDDQPRMVEVPPDLQEVLAADAALAAAFERLSFSHRKELVRWVQEAKRPETRTRRLGQVAERVRA